MSEENFNKLIKYWKQVRLSETEKSRMLNTILYTSVPSPYTYFLHMRPVIAMCFVAVLVFTGVVQASGGALPGDILYPIKTDVVEPVFDIINRAPEEKVVWEQVKIDRRIAEAEQLVEEKKLDDKKLDALKKKIEKSSSNLVNAIEIVASSTTLSTTSAKEKSNNLKRQAQKKIIEQKSDKNKREKSIERNQSEEDRREDEAGEDLSSFRTVQTFDIHIENDDDDDDDEEDEDKIQELKDAATRVLDRDRD